MEEPLKATRKHFSRLGGMFVLGTVIIYAVQLIPAILVRIFRPEWLQDGNINLTLSMVPMYLVGMPALIALVKRVPAETVEKKRMRWWQFVAAAVMCFGLMYVSNLIGTIISTVIGVLKGSVVQNALLDIVSSISVFFMILYMVICAPFMEEYVFRKLIVERTVKYGQGVAVVVSGLMFGLFHGNLNQFAYAFTLGCFLAFLYVKTGKLKITIAIHMMINLMGSVVSLKITELLDLERYMEIMADGMDMEALMAYVTENAIGWILYLMLALFVLASILVALIMFIVCIATKKFRFERGQVIIPKGKRFSTVILNAGMLIYCIFWIIMIVFQLFQ
ncbi:MAG: CPBP family intramembrane metalloprotease [Eubacterium sp.]|nr:CPBP family intramembrane metalloprotease [Eubacterium sp.]MCM1213801.1 CPBP family intramembrane metalloprotease [Lachnospiraceae bacterium]MCM1303321.1 CPBP family intramembrane metalloprotease [Butyrivibrio sp.]MCM1344692.1 CPBP family intramembrane metalloprotease [Muribaculaceae bacterium]MCM1237920.1 CPBP family intramembrane metalloprotease [Lachnospiraceae bacterium]